LTKLNAALAALEARAQDWLRTERVEPSAATIVRTAGLRYVHQGYEITVRLTDHNEVAGSAAVALTDQDIDALRERFHQEHERQYAWSSRSLAVELVNIGVTAYGRLPKLELHRRLRSGDSALVPFSRAVYFGHDLGTVTTPVYDFDALSPGWSIEGPAIVEQRFSTILILPRHSARMDDYGNILMEVRQ
jgi:N-methylhydantoinase A